MNTNLKKKIILDTSVLASDYGTYLTFEEHDVVILAIVLEEADHLKKGNDEKAHIIREFHRQLDKYGELLIPESPKKGVKKTTNMQNNKPIKMVSALHNGGVPLGEGLGNIEVRTMELKLHPKLKNYYSEIPDHHILSGVLKIMDEEKNRQVVLVSKDINLRQKARSLGIQVEDYRKDLIPVQEKPKANIISDPVFTDLISLIKTHGEAPIKGKTYSEALMKNKLLPNMGLTIKTEKSNTCLARVNATVTKLIRIDVQTVACITPRNPEQKMWVDSIINSGASLFLADGPAGTGKTLLAAACAIHLVRQRKFTTIIMTAPKVTVSGKDEGALPGDAIEKTKPYLLGLEQNINFIKSMLSGEYLTPALQPKKTPVTKNTGRNKKKEVKQILENQDHDFNYVKHLQEQDRIQIQPLSYVRGGTFNNAIIIVDESQNMTPHEAKTIITRAGNNTIVILCGDLEQISSPELSERSNGYSHAKYKMEGEEMVATVHLIKGERSPLATLAAKKM